MNMFSRKNRKGFTLIELIVVIAILAILAAIAVPSFIGITDNANNKVTLANASSIATAYNAYQVLNPGKLTSTTPDDIKSALTEAKLWPAGLPNDDATAMAKIWDDIQFSGTIATVKEVPTT